MQSFIMAPSSTVYSRMGKHLKPTTFDYRYVTACLSWGPLPFLVRICFEGHSNGGGGKTLNRFHVCVHLWVCLWVCLTLGKQWSPCFNWVWPSKSGGLNVTPASVPSGTHWNYSGAEWWHNGASNVGTHPLKRVCIWKQARTEEAACHKLFRFCSDMLNWSKKELFRDWNTEWSDNCSSHWSALTFRIELSCFRSKQRACTWHATSLIPIKVSRTD